MEILNVVTIKPGNLTEVKSFPITDDDNAQLIVIEAENYFIEQIRDEDGFNMEERETYIEDGVYFSHFGSNKYYLIWSV